MPQMKPLFWSLITSMLLMSFVLFMNNFKIMLYNKPKIFSIIKKEKFMKW